MTRFPPSASAVAAEDDRREHRPMQTRAVVSGTLGSTLEWFDFAIYGALSATLFPALFFSGLGETGSLLASFASFGVGFVARPLGGLIFGHLGDRYGRRPILLGTFIAMGASSIVIGLLPTGQGVAIAVLLVVMRFIQGFALGGEATGAQLMTMEHAAGNRRGVLGSLMNVGSPLSQVIANLTLVLLTSVLSTENWEAWGWRIPFLASILLVAVGVYIRMKLEETPAFVVHKREGEAEKPNGLKVLAQQPLKIAQLTVGWGGPALTFYLIAVYGLSYLSDQGVSSNDGFLILMVANGVSVVFCVLGGWVSDRIGRKNVLLIGIAGCLAGVLLFFPVADTGAVGPAMAVVILALGSVQFGFGAQPALFAEQFPTSTRFSGSALSLTFANLIFAAPAPMAATALTEAGGSRTVMWVTVGILVASALALLPLADKRGVDLASFTTLTTGKDNA
ncbi:Predicted arabinose efflux permease, MFS family [Prauserella marina]|uniref:Predicted arabinose efflux permease, MFS family n=1 Tax=Prauserella marina TaxID=530584 RepID=A0A1G6VI89_9PSEU|nr:MFS transporter [Prauserella marina]PWV80358.1 putative MFS family arabinose efflux permease [Prauserella marina]SDD52566.1 Predicted arabinose efflux permease, MFS family [Prauserella marina]